ncbi:MAG: hypothetical protein ACE5FT_03780 [Candidatus Nanoarchaeia archaeon]
MKKFKGIKRRKSKKNHGKLIVVLLAGIMVLSTVGFLMSDVSQSSSVMYNGHAIESTPQGLVVEFDGVDVPFTYYPDSVSDLAPSDGISLLRNSKVLVVSYDVSVEDPAPFGGVQYQMEHDWQRAGKYAIRALMNGENYTLPSLGCANATAQSPVIYYEIGNTTGYRVEGSCLIGTTVVANDVVRLRDALFYEYYGVYE